MSDYFLSLQSDTQAAGKQSIAFIFKTVLRNLGATFLLVMIFGASCRSIIREHIHSLPIIAKKYKMSSFSTKIVTFLDKKVRKSKLFMYIPDFFGFPDFEPRTPGIPEARATSPEWGVGFRNSGLFSGLSASLIIIIAF